MPMGYKDMGQVLDVLRLGLGCLVSGQEWIDYSFEFSLLHQE
jgi:hypothetical protein